jgi:hypothetical protein
VPGFSILTIMNTRSISKKVDSLSLLPDLYYEQKTGVITIRGDRRTIRVHLKKGLLTHAEGLDVDTLFLRKIAREKGLTSDHLNELIELKKNDPHSLGKTLIEHRFVSPSGWNKFLLLRARSHLAAALQMDGAHLEFRESSLNIPPEISVNCDLLQLLLESLRKMKDPALFRKPVPDADACFNPRPKERDAAKQLPLTPTESRVLSLIDGKRTVADLSSATDLGLDELSHVLCLLSFLGLIAPAQEKGEDKGRVASLEIINLYLDLYKILETNFIREVGREFEAILAWCTGELTGPSANLFQGIDVHGERQDKITSEIYDRFSDLMTSGESPLILSTSFNKLIYLLIMRMKKTLGIGIAADTLNEMLQMVSYVRKYRQDAEMINYMRENLEDYLRQIQF